MANEFVCPKCEATLRTAKPLEPGKRLKCPQCQEIVTVPAKESRVRAADRGAAPRSEGKEKAKRPRDDDEDEDRPRRSRDDEDDADDEEDEDPQPKKKKKKAKAKSGGKGLLIGLIIGGAVVLLGGVGLLLFFLLGGSNPLMGTWEGQQGPMKLQTEFNSGGRMKMTFNMPQPPIGNIPGMPAMPAIPPFSVQGSYKLKGNNTVEISVTDAEMKRAADELQQGLPPQLRGFVNPRNMGLIGKTTVEPYRVEGDTLTLSGTRMKKIR